MIAALTLESLFTTLAGIAAGIAVTLTVLASAAALGLIGTRAPAALAGARRSPRWPASATEVTSNASRRLTPRGRRPVRA